MSLASREKFGAKVRGGLLDVSVALEQMREELKRMGYDPQTALVRLNGELVPDSDGVFETRLTVYAERKGA